MSCALALRDLHFGYGGRATVRAVAMEVLPGDCYGFLGHNGAGKTTVMRLVLGLLQPSRGSVRVFGIDALQDRRAANARLGALVERPGFHRGESARDNLVSLARLQGMPRRLASAESDRVLELLGLRDAAARRVGTFSMGMRQRLGIAQALLGGPPLLLLDEPTNGLDPEGIADLRRLLRHLSRDERTAIVVSSHQLAELEDLCNRVGVLREGQMVVEGGIDELRRRVARCHVLGGPDPDAIARALRELGCTPERRGNEVAVDLGERAPAAVLRRLTVATDIASFALERTSLERIYLHAHDAPAESERPAVARTAARVPPPEPLVLPQQPPPRAQSPLGTVAFPQLRTLRHEAQALWRRRSTWFLVAAPIVVAVWSVHGYASSVQQGLAELAAESRFSADEGSGQLALVRALALATPVLCAALTWLASQTIAADAAADTLRNTLVRSVCRFDVAFAKLTHLASITIVAWLATAGVAAIAAEAEVGFHDLEEVSRYGDRELLAASADVWPVLLLGMAQMLLPLLAVVCVATTASALLRRPAPALVLALGLLFGPELLRDWLAHVDDGDPAGWLLTSHLAMPMRDDSVLAYAGAIARGAADAVWRWADLAVIAPLAWIAAAVTTLVVAARRWRIP